MRKVAITLLFWLSTATAFACTVCNSENGQQVRSGIFGEDFGKNVLLTVAPFPVVLGLIALACRALPDSNHQPDKIRERKS